MRSITKNVFLPEAKRQDYSGGRQPASQPTVAAVREHRKGQEGRGRERVDAAAQGNIHVRLLASLSIVNHGSKLNGSRCIIIPVELQRSIGVEKPSPPPR